MLRSIDHRNKDDQMQAEMTLLIQESTKSDPTELPNSTSSNGAQTSAPSSASPWASYLDRYSPTTRFVILCSGIFFFYLLYGYFQELIFTLDGMKPVGWYMTLVQFGLYTVFGFVETRVTGDTIRKIPWTSYFLLALLTVTTMGLSNSSVAYLNYPTQVMFKCCKLIPVLICTVLIQGKKIGILDVIAAIFMSLGLIFFTLADVQVSPKYDTTGVIMILTTLVADACIGNVQEKKMKEHKASGTEMVLYSYSVGFVYILFYLVVTGQLDDSFYFCAKHPVETYGYFTIFSITGYFGVQLVLVLIKSSGVFVAVTVTTCRKAVTIMLSFIFFSKPFTAQYIWSGLLVVAGIYLNIYSKNSPAWLSNFTVSNLLKRVRQKIGRYPRSQTSTLLV